MIPPVQEAFNNLIRRWPPPGSHVLELGATRETVEGFAPAVSGMDYVGIDLAPTEGDLACGVVQGDANSMPQFGDDTFDAVLTSSMFEHNPKFWLALAEVRRVLRPGGMFYVGVPGFSDQISTTAQYARSARKRLNRAGATRAAQFADRAVATRTYPFHDGPHDFFRFSPSAMRDVFLDGYEVLKARALLSPPRLQAAGKLLSH